ncbi:putative ribonuclease h protein [Quercus suber]|uniref:Ribonuclease h protein n=1 Tax=Quercus suber TaxID=58331 RepID=A0AAW0LYC4_QUESU|nr:putative ribonuclease h protein [Quercus suber]
MGDGPLRSLIHGPLDRDGDNLRVREVWDHQGQWSLHTLLFVLPHHVVDTIRATPKPLSLDQDDLLSWNYSTNGTFNPKSAYTISSNSVASHATCSWKWFWKVPTLPRVITFLWLACHGRLPTKGNLHSRHILHDDLCPFCLTSQETTLHILRDCPRVTPIWSTLFGSTPIPPYFHSSSTFNWIRSMTASFQLIPDPGITPWPTLFPIAAWSI